MALTRVAFSLSVALSRKAEVISTVLTNFTMDSNWAWMTETNISFPAASSLCNTSTVLAEKKWPASLSVTHNQMFSMDDISGDHAVQKNNPMYRRSVHGAQHVVSHYLVGKGCLADFDYRARPLDVGRQ
ncbi:hypothetical protein TNCV_2988671 [Trichonephila clavipes]|nr:hypothetical protein TNCV_2988671 [Trichonephila clavipes]